MARWVRFCRLVGWGVVVLACQACSFGDGATPAAPLEITSAPPEHVNVLPPTWTSVVGESEPLEIQHTMTPEPDPASTPTPNPVGWGPENFPPGINPLTGMPVYDYWNLNRRPVAVKISNFPRGIRPQWGLSLADHVYEYYHEGGLTRFFAVFLANDVEQVGPVRSARITDLDLIRMYKAIFVYGSGDDRVRRALRGSAYYTWMVTEFPAKCPPMCRIDPEHWNHLITSIPAVHAYTTGLGLDDSTQNLNGLFFLEQVPVQGLPAAVVSVRYSFSAYNRWDYDAAAGFYVRSEDKSDDQGAGEVYTPLVDGLTQQPVQAANVVVLMTPHELLDAAPEIVETGLMGSGSAYVFRDGYGYLVSWSRTDSGRVVALLQPDGSPFPLKPGPTWFQIVGQNTRVLPQPGEIWRFEHQRP